MQSAEVAGFFRRKIIRDTSGEDDVKTAVKKNATAAGWGHETAKSELYSYRTEVEAPARETRLHTSAAGNNIVCITTTADELFFFFFRLFHEFWYAL